MVQLRPSLNYLNEADLCTKQGQKDEREGHPEDEMDNEDDKSELVAVKVRILWYLILHRVAILYILTILCLSSGQCDEEGK